MPVTYIQQNPLLSLIGLIAIIAIIWFAIKQYNKSKSTSTNGAIGTRVAY